MNDANVTARTAFGDKKRADFYEAAMCFIEGEKDINDAAARADFTKKWGAYVKKTLKKYGAPILEGDDARLDFLNLRLAAYLLANARCSEILRGRKC